MVALMPSAGGTLIIQTFYLSGVRRARATALNTREEHNESA
jgi:hypothetical protein